MSQRTWLPSLLFFLDKLCAYIGRYERQLREFIPDADEPKLDAVLVACAALREVIIPLLPPQT